MKPVLDKMLYQVADEVMRLTESDDIKQLRRTVRTDIRRASRSAERWRKLAATLGEGSRPAADDRVWMWELIKAHFEKQLHELESIEPDDTRAACAILHEDGRES